MHKNIRQETGKDGRTTRYKAGRKHNNGFSKKQGAGM
jgi:hypothetical protein